MAISTNPYMNNAMDWDVYTRQKMMAQQQIENDRYMHERINRQYTSPDVDLKKCEVKQPEVNKTLLLLG